MATEKEEKEFTKKYVECNIILKRMRQNLVIDLGKLTIVLLYVLGQKSGKPTKLYGVQYGELEFSVGVIRFKLQFLPKNPGAKLICKHLEGMTYIDTQLELHELEPLESLISKVILAMEVVKPSDGI
jgi:hypothetical protein